MYYTHMSAKKRKKRLRPGRLAVLMILFVILIGGAGYGGYRLFRVFVPKKQVQEVIVPEKDVTADNVSADHTKQIEAIKKAHALDSVNVTGLSDEEIRSLFYSSEIDESLLNSMRGTTWSDDQDFIKPEQLRYIRVLYKNFDNQDTVGEIILNEQLAAEAEEIFYDLYTHDYQIERMILPDAYGGDDTQSMSNNNTNGFSMRQSDGVSLWPHEHALGLAIDLNPLMNPFVARSAESTFVTPPNAESYADRTNIRPHMIDKNDYAYQVFTAHGFTWGGDWSQRTDYQHFEKGYTAPAELPADVKALLGTDDEKAAEEGNSESSAEQADSEDQAVYADDGYDESALSDEE